MTSRRLSLINGFERGLPVFGVHLDKLQQDPADRPALAASLSFQALPQRLIHIAKRVFLHGSAANCVGASASFHLNRTQFLDLGASNRWLCDHRVGVA
jgi:hypothetical protein